MIPLAFEYHRPSDIAGALSVLTEHGDDARVIAGGHSLIPMMKLRMAEVPNMIDLQDIADLKGNAIEGDTITIGAMWSRCSKISTPLKTTGDLLNSKCMLPGSSSRAPSNAPGRGCKGETK